MFNTYMEYGVPQGIFVFFCEIEMHSRQIKIPLERIRMIFCADQDAFQFRPAGHPESTQEYSVRNDTVYER